MFKIRKTKTEKYLMVIASFLRRLFMKPVAGKTYEGKTIMMDFSCYEDCRFIDCRMVYMGIGSIDMDGVSYIDCAWEFDGPAGSALEYLKHLNEKAPTIIDMTFGIQRKKHDRSI